MVLRPAACARGCAAVSNENFVASTRSTKCNIFIYEQMDALFSRVIARVAAAGAGPAIASRRKHSL